MESAELKKNKRIRHAFSRRELYHRFVHSDEYAYSPSGTYQISCRGNYLFVGSLAKYRDVDTIESNWYYSRDKMIAIIDRDKKRILINTVFEEHVWFLKCAVPADYKIFYTFKPIPNKDILDNNTECLRIHAYHLIKVLVDTYYVDFYNGLNSSKSNSVHYNVNDATNFYSYNNVIKFVKENSIKKYDFYKECFDENYNLKIWTSKWPYKYVKIKFPTLQQIVNNKVFSKKEKLLLEQKYFYTKYCYGNGVPFKDVVDNWKKGVTIEEIDAYIKKRFRTTLLWKEDNVTWNDYIIQFIETSNVIYRNIIKENTDKSDANYNEARQKLDDMIRNSDYTVNDWRERKTPINQKITYRKYIAPKSKKDSGQWVDATISSYLGNSFVFPNTQLRLARNNIETSRYASVPFDAGVKMFNLFRRLRSNNSNKSIWTTSDFGNIKVGVYNLRFIAYKPKMTDDGKYLNRKEWVIQIGCHALWLDDIMDFIKYYHLEEEFGVKIKG